MTLEEASFSSTWRTIAVLLILWWLLRMYMRTRARATHRDRAPQRPPGDVRIERAPQKGVRRSDQGIIDAEYEEIK